MLDQATKLRELADGSPSGAAPESGGIPMIAVTGSRAGVGTTTVAANLAAVLSDRGERVVVVDAAEERANVAQVAGAGAFEHEVSDVVAGTCRAATALVAGPSGTMVLGARSGVSPRHGCESLQRRIFDRRDSPAVDYSRHAQQRLLTELQSLDELASVIVIDTGSKLTPWTQRFWLRSRLAILVTTADDAAVMDTYAALKRCTAEAVEANVRVLANQCDNDATALAVYSRLSTACNRFLSSSLATLPSLPKHYADPRFVARTAPRVWESPNTPFGHAVLWLGQAVSALLPGVDAARSAARAAVPSAGTSFFNIEQNRSSRTSRVADNSRHHTGVPAGVKLA